MRFLRVNKAPNGTIQITQEITLCDIDQIQSTLKSKSALESKQSELLEFFTLFFSSTPKPINTAQEFANAIALPTKYIKEEILALKDEERITHLYENFHKGLYEKLKFEDFCDNFAQTLVYALFLAKFHKDLNYKDLNDKESNEVSISLSNITDFIPHSVELLGGFANSLKELNYFKNLKWILDHTLCIINHISVANLLQEFNKHNKSKLNSIHHNPTLYFYEHFIGKYNGKLKKDKGVYYTHESIVSFIINAVDIVLKHDLGFKNGLQEATQGNTIKLLDFATGTGIFLLEAFRKAFWHYKELKDKANKKPADYDERLQNLIKNFRAFEILIAPYAIAHLNLTIALKDKFDYTLKDNERLHIFLTNTLEDKIEEQATLFEAKKEAEAAMQTKQSQILIITGNPLYNYNSPNKYDYIYTPPKAKNQKTLGKINAHYFICGIEKDKQTNTTKPIPINEDNPKGLQDDYMKFIHFAESKIQSQENGIIAIITNHGFIDNVTFRGARWHLLNNFDKIYILDLHGSVSKQEKDYEGKQDGNVFNIQQGVSINIFVKTHNNNKPKPPTTHIDKPPTIRWETYSNTPKCKVYHYDVYGTTKDKYNFLLQNDLHSIKWKVFTPKPPYYLFFSYDEALFDEYVQYISIKDIFKISNSGVQTSRDKFCISKSDSQESLQEFKDNITKFMNLDSESARKTFNLGKDSSDWKVQYAQKELKDTNNNPNNYVKIQYRPFDFRWTYFTPHSSGFLARPRGEVMQHFLGVESVGLIYCRQTRSSETFQHAFVCNGIMEMCYISNRGNERNYVAPLYLKQTDCHSEGAKRPKNLKQNRDSSLNATHFAQNDKDIKIHNDKVALVENFTQSFRTFIDTKYGERFPPEVILGYIYAVLFHKDYREKYIDFLKIDFPRIPFVESKEQFLALSNLGWDLIQTHLMQKSGDSDKGKAFFENEENHKIDTNKIAYKHDKKLFVNESLHFTNVSKEVWEYKIGGYQVLCTYLSYHKDDEKMDFKHFENIIKVLDRSLQVQKEIAKIPLNL